MHETDVLQEINKRYSKLSRVQKKIADYISKNPVAAAFSTVDEISRASGASPATVVRFANTLEFSGFSDFQNALQNQIENQMRPSSRLKERFPYLNSRVDPASMIFKTETENMLRTYELMSAEDIQMAVKKITDASMVLVSGGRSCYGVAHFLSYNLIRAKGNCIFLPPQRCDFAERLAKIGEGDVFVCVTLPRYLKQVVHAAKIAKQHGAFVISITDSHRSPLAEYSNILFPVAYKSFGFHNSIFAALMIVEFIISEITMSDSAASRDLLVETEEVLSELDVHMFY